MDKSFRVADVRDCNPTSNGRQYLGHASVTVGGRRHIIPAIVRGGTRGLQSVAHSSLCPCESTRPHPVVVSIGLFITAGLTVLGGQWAAMSCGWEGNRGSGGPG